MIISYTSAVVFSGAWDFVEMRIYFVEMMLWHMQIKFQSLGLLGLLYNLMISYTSADVFSRTWVFIVYADTISTFWYARIPFPTFDC